MNRATLCLNDLVMEPAPCVACTDTATLIPPLLSAADIVSKPFVNTVGSNELLHPFYEPMVSCNSDAREGANDSRDVSSTASAGDLPQKNTFIHFDLHLNNRPPTPTSTAPSLLLRRLFKIKDSIQSEGSQCVSSGQELQVHPERDASTCSDHETEVGTSSQHSYGSFASTPTPSEAGSPDGENSAMQKELDFPTDTKEEHRVGAPASSRYLVAEDPPRKNTFIHFNVPATTVDVEEPPTKSAPGILMSRLFKKYDTSSNMVENLQQQNASEPADDNTDGITRLSLGSISVLTDTTDSECSSTPREDMMATQGSYEAHVLGKCKPCNYFLYKVDGCRQGDNCTFCHFCPKGEIKKRKKDKLSVLRKAGLVPYKARVR
jgi:hypothetical protein